MRLRLEDMVDMEVWKGIDYYWGMSNWDRSKSFYNSFPMAMLSSSVAKLVMLPVDRFSFVKEVQSIDRKFKYDQIFKESALRKTLHPIGPFVINWTLTLPINETLRAFMLIRDDPGKHPISSFLCGALASVPGTLLAHPMYVSGGACATESARKGHNLGMISNLEARYIQGGYQYLYVGLKARVITNSIFAGLLFTSYTMMKQSIPPLNPDRENSFFRRLVFGVSAVFLSSLLLLPLEVSSRDIIYQSCQRHPDNVESFIRVLTSCKGKVLQRSGYLLMQVPAIAIALIMFEGFEKNFNTTAK